MSVSSRTGESVTAPPSGALRAALVSAGLFAIAALGLSTGRPLLAVSAAFAPYPLALARLGSGVSGALAALLAALFVAWVSPMGYVWAYAVAAAVPGLLLGESLARGRGLLRGCLWAFAWLTAVCAVALGVAGRRLSSWLLGGLDGSLEWVRLQGVPFDQLEVWQAVIGAARDVVSLVYPALVVVAAGLAMAINAALIRRYLLRRDPAWLIDGEFERLRWPFALVTVFVLSVAGLLVPAVYAAAANVLVLVVFLLVLHGLAVASFVGRRLLPPALPWIIVLVLSLTPLFVLVPVAALALLGLFDHWIDARRWAESKLTDDDED